MLERRQGSRMTAESVADMKNKSIRKRLDAYVREVYGIEPEILPFSHAEYEIYRHTESGKWFAVFIVKERESFGLPGEGPVEVLCVKPKDPLLADFWMQEPGYLRGYPSKKWNWLTMVLDGTVPYEDICCLLDESYRATKSKAKNKKTPLLPPKMME